MNTSLLVKSFVLSLYVMLSYIRCLIAMIALPWLISLQVLVMCFVIEAFPCNASIEHRNTGKLTLYSTKIGLEHTTE